jgi:two-component system NtrC family response regulator
MTATGHKLLFVEDDAGLLRQLRWSFSDYQVLTASDRTAALALVASEKPPVAVLDLGLPPDVDGASEGLATLEAIRSSAPHTKVVVMTGNEDRANAFEAIRLGAYDYCSKPVDIDTLKVILGRARHLQLLEEQLRQVNEAGTAPRLPDVITSAPAMLQVCRQIEKVAATEITVLLIGESGTGKEVLARALHKLSSRADKPFVAINCGAIPDNLLESELFGHERGAFTGAVKQTLGKVELAQGGTLFLDEVGDIPLPLQVKLLRFLQERTIERVGGRQSIAINVRVVCATHRNLGEMMRVGGFREDLYYRLSELTIKIPPLRDRPGDALLLTRYMLDQLNAQYGRKVRGLSSEAKAVIEGYAWPGNVRELQSQIRRALLMTEGDLIMPADLDLVRTSARSGRANGSATVTTLKEIRRGAEREAVTSALSSANGNISQAAKLLGVSRPTMYELMRVHGVRQ